MGDAKLEPENEDLPVAEFELRLGSLSGLLWSIPAVYTIGEVTYTIIECIASGAFGSVYKATSSKTGLEVAIKIQAYDSPPETARDEKFGPKRWNDMSPSFTWSGMRAHRYTYSSDHQQDDISPIETKQRKRCLREVEVQRELASKCQRDPTVLADLDSQNIEDFFPLVIDDAEFVIPMLSLEPEILRGSEADQYGVRVHVMTMVLCEESLHNRLGRFSTAREGWHLWERISCALQVLMCITILHRCEILHRDIKAQNILLGFDKRWKVGDFGISSGDVLSDRGLRKHVNSNSGLNESVMAVIRAEKEKSLHQSAPAQLTPSWIQSVRMTSPPQSLDSYSSEVPMRKPPKEETSTAVSDKMTPRTEVDKYFDLSSWALLFLQLMDMKDDQEFNEWIKTAGEEEAKVELAITESKRYPGLDSLVAQILTYGDASYDPVKTDIVQTWLAVLGTQQIDDLDYSSLSLSGVLTFISSQNDVSASTLGRVLGILRRLVEKNVAAFHKLVAKPAIASNILSILQHAIKPLSDLQEAYKSLSDLESQMCCDAMLIVERSLSLLARSGRFHELWDMQQQLHTQGGVVNFLTTVIGKKTPQLHESIPLLASRIVTLLSVRNQSFIDRYFNTTKSESPGGANAIFVIRNIAFMEGTPGYPLLLALTTTNGHLCKLLEEFDPESTQGKNIRWVLDLLQRKRTDDGPDASEVRLLVDFLRLVKSYAGTGHTSRQIPSNWTTYLKGSSLLDLDKKIAIELAHLLSIPDRLEQLRDLEPDVDWLKARQLAIATVTSRVAFRRSNINNSMRSLCLNRKPVDAPGMVPWLQWAMIQTPCECTHVEGGVFGVSTEVKPTQGRTYCLLCAESAMTICRACGNADMTLELKEGEFQCFTDESAQSLQKSFQSVQLQPDASSSGVDGRENPAPRMEVDCWPNCFGWAAPISSRVAGDSRVDTSSKWHANTRYMEFIAQVGIIYGNSDLENARDPEGPGGTLSVPFAPIKNSVTFSSLASSETTDGKPTGVGSPTSPQPTSYFPNNPSLVFWKELKLTRGGRDQAIALGLTSIEAFPQNETTTSFEEGDQTNSPVLAYQAQTGKLLYSRRMRDNSPMEIVSRTYGPPVELGSRLAMGITAEKQVFFVADRVVLPNIALERMDGFPLQQLWDDFEKQRFCAFVSLCPRASVHLLEYRNSSASTFFGDKLLRCPLGSEGKGERLQALEKALTPFQPPNRPDSPFYPFRCAYKIHLRHHRQQYPATPPRAAAQEGAHPHPPP